MSVEGEWMTVRIERRWSEDSDGMEVERRHFVWFQFGASETKGVTCRSGWCGSSHPVSGCSHPDFLQVRHPVLWLLVCVCFVNLVI